MMVMSPSPMNAPSIVSPSSMVRQITSATGQEEQVDFMVSLGCENGGLEHLHFPPKAHLHSGLTTPRKHPSTHSENGRATLRPGGIEGLAWLVLSRGSPREERKPDGYRRHGTRPAPFGWRHSGRALARLTRIRPLTDRRTLLVRSGRPTAVSDPPGTR